MNILIRLSQGSADLSSEEIGTLVGVGAVGEMGSENGGREVAVADGVAGVRGADDLDLVGGEVGDLTAVGAELGVAKGDNTDDLGLLSGGEILDGAVVEGGTLAVWVRLLVSCYSCGMGQKKIVE